VQDAIRPAATREPDIIRNGTMSLPRIALTICALGLGTMLAPLGPTDGLEAQAGPQAHAPADLAAAAVAALHFLEAEGYLGPYPVPITGGEPMRSDRSRFARVIMKESTAPWEGTWRTRRLSRDVTPLVLGHTEDGADRVATLARCSGTPETCSGVHSGYRPVMVFVAPPEEGRPEDLVLQLEVMQVHWDPGDVVTSVSSAYFRVQVLPAARSGQLPTVRLLGQAEDTMHMELLSSGGPFLRVIAPGVALLASPASARTVHLGVGHQLRNGLSHHVSFPEESGGASQSVGGGERTFAMVINGWVIRPTPYGNLQNVVDSIRNQRGTFAPST